MDYNFYFDETFHDRKITISSEGVLNILLEDKNDNYIGAFWGCKKVHLSAITKELIDLENKYKNIYGLLGEFKSTTIDRNNFKYGIVSMNKNAFNYYKDFFEMLNKIKPIIHINILSKVEWLVRNIFNAQELKRVFPVVPNLFYYSIAKFIFYYHSPTLIKALWESQKTQDGEVFKRELLKHIERVLIEIEGIARKDREYDMLQELRMIVANYKSNITINEKYDFVYFQNFHGLTMLLNEKKIKPKRIDLIIDKEAETYRTAKRFSFHKVTEVSSDESIHVRVSDHICGFVGRMIYSLMTDENMKEDKVLDIDSLGDNDLERKRILSQEWFKLKPKHFDLYKQIQQVLVVQQEAYWATMTWSYGDYVSVFYSLVNYISSYEDYVEYQVHTYEEHAEKFNTWCCGELQRHYDEMLEIEHMNLLKNDVN